MCGLPFSGKTTLAKQLAQKLGFIRIDIDEIKFEKGYKNVSDDDVPNKMWEKIYDEMFKRIYNNLSKGKNVISDKSNLEKDERNRMQQSTRGEFPVKVIYINILPETVRRRWLENKKDKKRFDISEKIFNEAIDALQEPSDDENIIIYDQTIPIEDWIKRNFYDSK